jgi:hypothetical protein
MKLTKTLTLLAVLFFTHSLPALAVTSFYQGFETDKDGWMEYNSPIDRVVSGNNGVTSASGSYHALITAPDSSTYSGAFTRLGGYSDTWPGGFTASLDIYLDTDWSLGSGFDYSVAASRSNGNHLRDFIFHVAKDTSTGSLLVAGSNNSNFATIENLESGDNYYTVGNTGWFTFQHVFYDLSGALAVDMNLLDDEGNLLFKETRSNPSDLIDSVVGGNRYGWITFASVDDGLNIDNSQLNVVPEPSTLILMGAGFLGILCYCRRKSS